MKMCLFAVSEWYETLGKEDITLHIAIQLYKLVFFFLLFTESQYN